MGALRPHSILRQYRLEGWCETRCSVLAHEMRRPHAGLAVPGHRWCAGHRCTDTAEDGVRGVRKRIDPNDKDVFLYEPPIVILTALNLELSALRPHIAPIGRLLHRAGTRFEVGVISGAARCVAIGVTGEGNHAAAVLTERAISLFRTDTVLFVGTAGSLRSDVEPGDIVVATRVHAYHAGRADPNGFRRSPRSWESSHSLVQLARHVAMSSSWKRDLGEVVSAPAVHFGGVAAGEVILNHRGTGLASHLRRDCGDALAIEMESAGVIQAVHLNRAVSTLTVRGISDRADGSKEAFDRAGWRNIAAANAAAFAAALVRTVVSVNDLGPTGGPGRRAGGPGRGGGVG